MAEDQDRTSKPSVDDFYAGLPQQSLDAYRAIGRYFVTFSSMIDFMRSAVITEITWEDEQRRNLLHMTLGQLSAQETADAFFAICRQVADPKIDEREDREIERVLRDHVNQTIRRRNVIAHGNWLIDDLPDAPPPPEDDPDDHALLARVRASSVSKPFHYEALTAADIDAEIEGMRGLDLMLKRFSDICMKQGNRPAYPPPGARLRDHFLVLGSANARYVDLRPSDPAF